MKFSARVTIFFGSKTFDLRPLILDEKVELRDCA